MRWARRVGLRRKLSIGLALAAVGAGVATYGSLTGNPPYGPEPRTVLVLLLIDLVLLLSLGALVARRLARLWAERRRGSAGSRLHTSFVAAFSAVAVAPVIIVAVFSALFFNLGIQAWFSERVRTALNESLAVARPIPTNTARSSAATSWRWPSTSTARRRRWCATRSASPRR